MKIEDRILKQTKMTRLPWSHYTLQCAGLSCVHPNNCSFCTAAVRSRTQNLLNSIRSGYREKRL